MRLSGVRVVVSEKEITCILDIDSRPGPRLINQARRTKGALMTDGLTPSYFKGALMTDDLTPLYFVCRWSEACADSMTDKIPCCGVVHATCRRYAREA